MRREMLPRPMLRPVCSLWAILVCTASNSSGVIIADQLNVDADSITAESRFKEDLEADSLDLFELVMALEEEYGVEIPSEDLEKILTVQDVIDYMKNKGVEA